MLIDLSFFLSSQLNSFGSPEGPLSNAGLMAYRSYWKDFILKKIQSNRKSTEIDLNSICKASGIETENIIDTLISFEHIKRYDEKAYLIYSKDDLNYVKQKKLNTNKYNSLFIDPALFNMDYFESFK